MVITFARESSIGFKAWRLRRAQFLSQQELAAKAGVPLEEVDLFENNLPVPLDTRRKVLKELLYMKSEKESQNLSLVRS